MKPVNVLPVFVSQDIDSKVKDISSISTGNACEADFSSMVDQHLSDDKTVTDNSQSKDNSPSSSAKNGDVLAANGNRSTSEKNEHHESNTSVVTRQESDSQAATQVNKGAVSPEAEVTEVVEVIEADKSGNDDATTSEALAESEQFISLLYHSDKTLADGASNLINVAQDTNANSSVKEHDNQAKAVDAQATSKTTKQSGSIKSNDLMEEAKNNTYQTSEHKLKVFTKDELLAQEQSKKNNVLAQNMTGQALQDYQKSLQSQQDAVTSNSITSKPVMTAQLTNTQLKTDIASSVSQVNTDLLKEQKAPDYSELPVEPIGKVKKSTENLAKDTADKTMKGNIEELVKVSNKQHNEGSDKVVAQVNKERVISAKEVTNRVADAIPNKAGLQDVKVDDVKVAANIDSLDKLIIERSAQPSTVRDNTVESQQVKSPANITAQTQVLPPKQTVQKEQVVDSELQANDEVGDELAYRETTQLSQDKIKEQGSVISNKATDNSNSRTVSNIHVQTIQANQIKQSNEAYIEHQVSEVLNHAVASDTAQIQKNNVQLQQEIISIFKKDFADAVKDKVMVMINQKLQQFDITLDPPEFGNMQVRVNLQGEQAAVNFIVQNQQAKDALEENMHKLKSMLADQGVDVGGANVEQQNQQQNQEDNNDKGGTNNSSRLNGQQGDELDVQQILSAKLFDSSATGVDYYA